MRIIEAKKSTFYIYNLHEYKNFFLCVCKQNVSSVHKKSKEESKKNNTKYLHGEVNETRKMVNLLNEHKKLL